MSNPAELNQDLVKALLEASWKEGKTSIRKDTLAVATEAVRLLANEIVHRCKRHAIDEANAAAMCADEEPGEPRQTQQQPALVDLEHLNNQLTRVLLDLG